MQRDTHTSHSKTAITVVREHVEDWRRAERWSRESMADQIVQAHERIDGPRVTGIKFEPHTTDAYERQRVNADRIYRWLDDHSKDNNLLTVNFLPSILAALPEDRRLHLAEDLLGPLGLACMFSEPEEDACEKAVVQHFQDVVAHGAEANVAMAQMIDGVDHHEPAQAKKKLALAAASIRRALGFVGKLIKRRPKG